MSDTHPSPHSTAPNEQDASTAGETLADGVAGLLNKETVAKAISNLVDAAADAQKKKPSTIKLSMILGILFSSGIFIGVALLGAKKIISGEATAGLLGTLIGYWFGQHQNKL